MFHLPGAIFVVLIVANFFAFYLPKKSSSRRLFVVSLFIPSPFSIVLVILIWVLLLKLKQEHF
jgi:ABC-type sugar transport system permease subunit